MPVIPVDLLDSCFVGNKVLSVSTVVGVLSVSTVVGVPSFSCVCLVLVAE